jgi:glycosyltransferase involved in cell wall biosynthesis
VAFYQPWIGPLLAAAPETATGGAETHVFIVARALADRGHRVAVITWPVETELPESIDGVRILQLPPLKRVWPISRFIRVVRLAQTLRLADARVLVQKNASFETGLVGLFARRHRRRFVWAASNVVDFDYAQIERSRTSRFLFRLGVRLANARVVQTEEQLQLCRDTFGLPATVIPNPAEPSPTPAGPARAFLWAARCAPYKRPEAYVELARSVPEAHFRMVVHVTHPSEEALLEELHRAAEELPNLEVLGPRPRADLLEMMDSAVAIVNTADFEGMPNVFLEGWARGVPALALTHDPDGVVEREGLGGFARGSSERLGELAADLWANRENQADLARRCREHVATRHSIDAVVDRWERVLDL